MSAVRWEHLPEHIIVQVFSYLPLSMKYHASLTCKSWNACFESHYLWENFKFHFMHPSDDRFLSCVTKYGHLLRDVSVHIDQELSTNRENACRILHDIAGFKSLQRLHIKFVGENPYFYAGSEFIDALKNVFENVHKIDEEGLEKSKDIESKNSNALPDSTTSIDTPVEDIVAYKPDCQSTSTDTQVQEKHHAPKRKANELEGQSKRYKPTTANIATGDEDSATAPVSLFVPESDDASNLSNNSIYVKMREKPAVGQLRDVDLSGLSVCIDDSLISLLANHHPLLEKLNIQNKVLVVKVSPSCILNVVQNCRKLRDLRLYMCSMSTTTLECFTEENRVPLQHLSLFCRREEKYGKELGETVWSQVVKALPRLRVTLIFDHTCPLFRINEIMKPQIPVHVLRLETFTYIYEEVRQAANYYPHCLETLVLETPLSRNSPELNSALILLAEQCTKLKSLHVFCVIEKVTVERILELRPVLRDRKSYTLKYTQEPHPWYAGKDCL